MEEFVVLQRTNACLTERRLRQLQQIGMNIDGERAADELLAVEEMEERRRMHEQRRPKLRGRHIARFEEEHRMRQTCGLYRRTAVYPEGSESDPGERA